MSVKDESLVGFDPAVTFSDSDSEDLYSVNVDEIKACAKAAASAKRDQNDENPYSSKRKVFKSLGATDAKDVLVLSDEESSMCRTPLVPTSPDVNSVRISSRRLVKMKKKTLDFFEKVDKLNFDANDCDLSLNQSGDVEVLCEENINHKVSVSVKCGATITKIPVGWLDKFGMIYQKMCELHEVSFDQVVLSLRDTILRPDETPASVGLSIVDVVECGFIKKKGNKNDERKVVSSKQEDVPEDSNCIQLKMQCSTRRGVLYVTVNKFGKLAEAMAAYSSERGKQVNDFKFMFDGEKLDPEETGITLGLEGGECIDVYDV